MCCSTSRTESRFSSSLRWSVVLIWWRRSLAFFFFSSRRRHTRSLCDWFRRVLFRSFVRRGLPGEVILALSKQGINPYLVIMGLSFGIWLVLFLALLKLSVRRGFPPLVICSQLCMLADRKSVV